MKTAIKTLVASTLTAIVLTSSAFTTFAKDGGKNSLNLNTAKGYSMIEAKGNVKVILVQSETENISVNTIRPEDKVLVQQQGQKLVISSNELNPAEVYVYLKDLKRIMASGRASVETDGNFKLSALQVFLSDEAEAAVNTKTESIYTVIKDNSHLNLTGSTNEHILLKDATAKLNTSRFAALKTQNSNQTFAAVDFNAQFEESLASTTFVEKNLSK